MTDEHVVLSERPEDQLKAVEWAREQKKKSGNALFIRLPRLVATIQTLFLV